MESNTEIKQLTLSHILAGKMPKMRASQALAAVDQLTVLRDVMTKPFHPHEFKEAEAMSGNSQTAWYTAEDAARRFK